MPQPFRCKQFSILQCDDVFKITSDTTLLGAWADISGSKKLLEIGCGSGMISLMLAQRNSAVLIEAIDIQQDSVKVAKTNFSNSPWADRLRAYNLSLQDVLVKHPHAKYDCIITNPPYYNSTSLPTNSIKQKSKHDHLLPADDLFSCSSRLLNDVGSMHIIIPSERSDEYNAIAADYSLYPQRWCSMFPRKTSSAKRELITYTRKGSITEPSEETIMYDAGGYHASFSELLKDFLIIF